MPNDAARLVYLLQHCSPNVRRGLEHFSRNNVTGYRLARQSLFNVYGQPHIIAYCCEQKLLSCFRLKTKDPNGLKDLSILMDKCLGIMDDIGDFAALNSFGTIQRITGKLPEEMQRDGYVGLSEYCVTQGNRKNLGSWWSSFATNPRKQTPCMGDPSFWAPSSNTPVCSPEDRLPLLLRFLAERSHARVLLRVSVARTARAITVLRHEKTSKV